MGAGAEVRVQSLKERVREKLISVQLAIAAPSQRIVHDSFRRSAAALPIRPEYMHPLLSLLLLPCRLQKPSPNFEEPLTFDQLPPCVLLPRPRSSSAEGDVCETFSATSGFAGTKNAPPFGLMGDN